MKKQIDNTLLIMFLLHKTTEAENREILIWLEEDSNRIILLDKLALAVAQFETVSTDEETLHVLKEKVVLSLRNRHRLRILMRVAAVFLGLALISGVLVFGKRKSSREESIAEIHVVQQVIESPRGVVTRFILADGTKVWLAPASKLYYPSAFRGTKRLVSLVGQAYFEVTHSETKHFVVKTKFSKIEVLGTKFNVMAYPNGTNEKATLVEGCVNINLNKSSLNQKGTVLSPNQTVTYNKNSDSFSVEKADVEFDLAWKESKIAFRDETFMDVLHKIELARNVHFIVDEKSMPKKRFTGNFDHESLNEILSTLQKISTFNFTISHNNVVITFTPMS